MKEIDNLEIENTARRVVANVPPCLVTKGKKSYYAAIIGDTKMAKELLCALITMAQLEQSEVQIDVITDKKRKECISSKWGVCPFLKIHVQTLPFLFEEEKIYRYVGQKEQYLDQIYLCTGKEEYDLRLEKKLLPIMSKYHTEERAAVVNVSSGAWKQYGLLRDCSETIIEQMGKEIFLDYAHAHGMELCFEELSSFEQRANYNSAMHIPIKLYLVGARIRKASSPSGNAFETNEQFLSYLTEERITWLTRLEHLRWCAFYLVSGYTYLPEEQAHGILHDRENRRHACLVPWEELPLKSIQYACDFIKEDRDRIIHMFDYVRNSGHVIERITPGLSTELLRKPSDSVCPR